MRTVLVVSPHFPPINAPDMHRVRTSLPYFAEFGWKPILLAVAPAYVERVWDPLLLDTLPFDLLIRRIRALPVRWTRKVGLGNLGLRALPFLYRAGAEMIKQHDVDLLYFSTTMFPTMVLGRIWNAQFGIPFVLDMQDPWVNDYHQDTPMSATPLKHRLARRLHGVLEPWTMKQVAGLLAVSADYIATLQRRYPWLVDKPCKTLPFGATETDFNIVRQHPQANRFFQPGDGQVHGVYVGRGGEDMAPALRIIFHALRRGLDETPAWFSKVHLHFIGTDYATDHRVRKTVEPLAKELETAAHVYEHPRRIPYFETLQLLLDADFLLVLGSADPGYTASKLYPYILARKPLLTVVHERSPMGEIVRGTRAGMILPFAPEQPAKVYAKRLLSMWAELLRGLPGAPQIDGVAFRPYTARETTRQQCELFDHVFRVQPSHPWVTAPWKSGSSTVERSSNYG